MGGGELVVVALAGFSASMVDGALGMGFGPTSSSILLAAGVPPAATSASVNLAKVASGLAAGISHWRFGNIDRRLVLRLALPGAAGAAVGAFILTSVDPRTIRPLLALLLLAVGARILLRFRLPLPVRSEHEDGAGSARLTGVELVGAAGGVTNGLVGAWGPVATPFLLHRGLPPRLAVGSVNTAEVAVAVVASGSLLASMDSSAIEIGVVLAMLVGGVLAAPLAAWVVRWLPPRPMGLAVAALLLLTQTRELSAWGGLGAERWAAYGVVAVAVALAGAWPRLPFGRAGRARRAARSTPVPAPGPVG